MKFRISTECSVGLHPACDGLATISGGGETLHEECQCRCHSKDRDHDLLAA